MILQDFSKPSPVSMRIIIQASQFGVSKTIYNMFACAMFLFTIMPVVVVMLLEDTSVCVCNGFGTFPLVARACVSL